MIAFRIYFAITVQTYSKKQSEMQNN